METAANGKRSAKTGTSGQRCNMECPGGSRENVDSVSLACVSGSHGGHSADGHRSFDGYNRILLKRLRPR